MSFIAQSALIGGAILLSSDHHLIEAQDHPRFRQILRSFDVEGDDLVIATPRKIATQYFRRK